LSGVFVSKIGKGTTFTIVLLIESGEHTVQEIAVIKKEKDVSDIEERLVQLQKLFDLLT